MHGIGLIKRHPGRLATTAFEMHCGNPIRLNSHRHGYDAVAVRASNNAVRARRHCYFNGSFQNCSRIIVAAAIRVGACGIGMDIEN